MSRSALAQAERGERLDRAQALALIEAPLSELMRAARGRRERARPGRISYSPNIFLPITRLCRDACDYCSFRRSPESPAAWTMSPEQVEAACVRGRAAGAVEALFCLGDRPEAISGGYRDLLLGWGHESTVSYLVQMCRLALAHGLLPHTNAGVLGAAELRRLAPVNASMGLMLESASVRLCEPGQAHAAAPDKHPARRLAMHAEAGRQHIAFTSGMLLGIGETPVERLDTLLAIREVDAGHIQEVIIQRFRAAPGGRRRAEQEPGEEVLARWVALARLLLPDAISVQAPPNLSVGDEAILRLLDAGADDLGGISTQTPDFINPGHPWPQLELLRSLCRRRGLELRPRLPIGETRVDSALHPRMRSAVRAARARLFAPRAAR